MMGEDGGWGGESGAPTIISGGGKKGTKARAGCRLTVPIVWHNSSARNRLPPTTRTYLHLGQGGR